jgi:hypothetical protein
MFLKYKSSRFLEYVDLTVFLLCFSKFSSLKAQILTSSPKVFQYLLVWIFF